MESAGTAKEPLEITVSASDGDVMMVLVGEFDLATETLLSDAVEKLRPLQGALVVDLGAVEFIDSSGLRALVGAHHAAIADTGGGVRLLRCTAGTTRLLQLSGLLDVFDLG